MPLPSFSYKCKKLGLKDLRPSQVLKTQVILTIFRSLCQNSNSSAFRLCRIVFTIYICVCTYTRTRVYIFIFMYIHIYLYTQRNRRKAPWFNRPPFLPSPGVTGENRCSLWSPGLSAVGAAASAGEPVGPAAGESRWGQGRVRAGLGRGGGEEGGKEEGRDGGMEGGVEGWRAGGPQRRRRRDGAGAAGRAAGRVPARARGAAPRCRAQHVSAAVLTMPPRVPITTEMQPRPPDRNLLAPVASERLSPAAASCLPRALGRRQPPTPSGTGGSQCHLQPTFATKCPHSREVFLF